MRPPSGGQWFIIGGLWIRNQINERDEVMTAETWWALVIGCWLFDIGYS